jgi:hypothetical protein
VSRYCFVNFELSEEQDSTYTQVSIIGSRNGKIRNAIYTLGQHVPIGGGLGRTCFKGPGNGKTIKGGNRCLVLSNSANLSSLLILIASNCSSGVGCVGGNE